MADFSSLKQIIQSYIKQNGNEEITGNILQDVLLAMVSTMGDSAINGLASALQDEITARQNQDGTLQGNITAEATARQNQDATLQGNINAEATARQQADTALGGRIDGLQTAINSINTKLAEGYIYAGIATPSTNPGTPSSKVFYIAVSSGTYTNFSNLTAAQGINILKYNGSAWSKDVVYTVDARPKKNSQNFVTSGGIFDNMGALDVSELNATENPHTPALYADLSAALAAIPSDYQKGGMSIKFVQSSDNKYVQYRLMANEWSTNTDDWAIAEEGIYVENPEFIYVKTDREGKILWAIKIDGGIYYGAGVPQQVIDYIQQKIDELSLDEYEDMVAFLNDLEKGDKTLQDLLNEKVDKEEGKSLINAEYANGVHYIENPEFIEAKVDAEDKILEATEKDGTKLFGGDVKVLGSIDVNGVSCKVVTNPEWLKVVLDSEDRIICGIKTDGKFVVYVADFLDDIENIKAFLANFNAIENPEFIEVELDANDKVLGGRKVDGTKFENNDVELNGNATVGGSLEVDGTVIKNIEDPEGRLEIATDSENKIISYRKDDGTLVENVCIETNHLELTEQGMTDFQQALKDSGFKSSGYGDWSDKEFVHIPMPKFALVNITCDKSKESITAKSGLGTPGVDCEIPAFLEFWDMQGNYFKKPIEISAQGSSSMSYYVKNNAIDITDGSVIKFGNLVEQDSFHLKKYYQDIYRGQCVVAYHLMEQVYKTRPVGKMKPWDYLNDSTSSNGSGNFIADFNEAALAHPDGFPFTMFWNGAYSGLYSFCLKKHRANYNMKKNEYRKIILDGEIGSDTMWDGVIDWTAFEIRNPKDLYYAPYSQLSAETQEQIDNGHISKSKTVDGVKYYKYDGDFPDILTDNASVDGGVSAFVRGSIERLATSKALIEAASAEDKPRIFESFFNKDFMIDYFVTSQVLYHWDGFRKNWIWCIWDADYDSNNQEYTGHWIPTIYDCDSIWGITWNGTEFLNTDGEGVLTLGSSDSGTKRNPATLCYELYRTDIQTRYSELKDDGIFTINNLMSLMNDWVGRIGYENLSKEVEYMKSINCDVPSYRDSSAQYTRNPQSGGVYNSLKRVCEWIGLRLTWLSSNL